MKKVSTCLLLIEFFISLQANPCHSIKKQGYGPGFQDWGWYEVRKGAHMFYWLFYTQDPTALSFYDKPLVIYLFGGPGISTTGFGNFYEVGPLFLNGIYRQTSWAKHVNLLFIDNPVGTGYSYLEPGENLTSTDEDIGAEMVEFLTKFYSDHSEFNPVPLYIFGESYGGKMVVEIAKQLYAGIKAHKLKANFKGIALGDPWISPYDSIKTSSSVLLHTGIVDQEGHDRIMNPVKKMILDPILKGEKIDGYVFFKLLQLVRNETGGVNVYNYLEYERRSRNDFQNVSELPDRKCDSENKEFVEINNLMNGNVRKSLEIPTYRHFKESNPCVFDALRNEFMLSVTDVVEEILNGTNLQVVVYNGQLDLLVSSLSTLQWVDRLKWPGSSLWKSASREPLIINGTVEGYVKSAGKLHFYWINRAGHMVPITNPKAALELLRRVTKFDKPVKPSF